MGNIGQVIIKKNTHQVVVKGSIMSVSGSADSSRKTGTLGDTVSAFRMVRLESDGMLYQTGNINISEMSKIIGMALNSGTAGGAIQYLSFGEYENAVFTFTPGTPLFLGANGELTNTYNDIGEFMDLGRSITDTKLVLNINNAIEVE